jgi:hypothetical protein
VVFAIVVRSSLYSTDDLWWLGCVRLERKYGEVKNQNSRIRHEFGDFYSSIEEAKLSNKVHTKYMMTI